MRTALQVMEEWEYSSVHGNTMADMKKYLDDNGYVIVPREPSADMLKEGGAAGGFDGEWMTDNTAEIWRAMISAHR